MKYIITLTIALAGMLTFVSPANAGELGVIHRTIEIQLSLHKMHKDASAAIINCFIDNRYRLPAGGVHVHRIYKIPVSGELETRAIISYQMRIDNQREYPLTYICSLGVAGSNVNKWEKAHQGSSGKIYARAKKGVFFNNQITGTIAK